MKRTILIFTVLLICISFLSASGGKEADTSQKRKVSITFLGKGEQEDLLAKWIPVFEAQNPDIQVEYTVLDWGTGKTKILTSFAGGVGSDIVMVYGADIPQWIEYGAISPIDEYFDPADYVPTAFEMGKWNGSLYAVPLQSKLIGYYYRSDKYEEAGLNPDAPPKDWAELIDYSQKLTKRDPNGQLQQSGFWVTTSHSYKTVGQYATFLWSAGGRIFSEDGTKCTVNSPEGVKTAEFLRDMLHVYKVDDAGSIQNESTDFAQGKMASGVCNNAPRGMEVTNPDEVKYVRVSPVPPIDGNHTGYCEIGGDYLGISATCKDRDAAAKVLKFLVETPEIVIQSCIDSFGPPALLAAVEGFSERSEYAEVWNTLANGNVRTQPLHPRWGEIQAILTKALDIIYLQPSSDPQKVLDDAAVQIDAIIKASVPALGE